MAQVVSQTPILVRRPQVEALTGLKRSSMYALMRAGQFPRPIKLSARAVAWPLQAIQQWVEARAVASSSTGGVL